jgi:hypothetical protein
MAWQQNRFDKLQWGLKLRASLANEAY